jgi:arsenite methyltransferase
MSLSVDPSTEDYVREMRVYNQFMKPIYQQALAHLPFQGSVRGLDAGCGPGGLLPSLCHLMGDRGEITALDASTAHLEAAQQLCEQKELTSRVTLKQADLRTILPFADDTFDWVWTADVLHPGYFPTPDDPVSEFVRVTRPGGHVVIFFEKMYESKIFPGQPYLDTLYRRYLDYYGRKLTFDNQPNNLHIWLKRNGCEAVQLHTFTMIHAAPLTPETRHYLQDIVAGWIVKTPMDKVMAAGISENEWQALFEAIDPESPDCVFDHPDYYCIWIALMAIGRNPT